MITIARNTNKKASTSTPVIENWKIVPEEGGGVCVTGTKDGEPWRTTTLLEHSREGGRKWVKTRSGSVYLLGEMDPYLWRLQLQMKRPAIHDKFAKAGFFD